MIAADDEKWMRRALELARAAANVGEVPVGAVIVQDDQVIGEGYNRPISSQDPTAHAEIIALRAAAEKIKNYRLLDTKIYVTLEPCLMCVGALVHARVNQLIHGASDPKAGAVSSCAQLLDSGFLNHRVDYRGGVLAQECGELLVEFFKARRT